MSNLRSLVFIPAFNEQVSIGKVIDELLSLDLSVLIVDDGSKDRTDEIISEKNVEIISHEDNLGYEKALSTGFNAACNGNYTYALSFDADGQMNTLDVIRFISIADKTKADLVVGIRNYRNRLSEYLLSIYGKTRFNIVDPLCGMKLYRLSSVKHLLPFDTKKLVGMEMAFKISNNTLKIVQVPVKIKKKSWKFKIWSKIKRRIKYPEVFV